jgi:hypothetical protein
VAFRANKDLIVAENAAKETEIRMLREQLQEKKEEILELKATVRRTQDALIAKESPDAYQDQVNARYDAEATELTEEQRTQIEQGREVARMNEELLSSMESPLFHDADDMLAMLARPQGAPEAPSFHGDDES